MVLRGASPEVRTVLGIETSCDETALAILQCEADGRYRILAEEISSQVSLHAAYGGVVPELASREHLRNLPIVCAAVLKGGGVTLSDLDLIAVTRGPGLKGCLLMGLNFAKGLAVARDTPIIGVNHIEGHLLAPFLDNSELDFPFLSLVVSGGHTEIVLVEGVGNYRILARTIDDAAGEAFDKAASLLGFPYPGGAQLAAYADAFQGVSSYKLPKVMREAEGFSFSGLKTAISLLVKKEQKALESVEMKQALCATIQDAIIDALLFKLHKAMRETGVRTVTVTGGVSANKKLRGEVAALGGVKSYFPAPFHSTDNGTMIAYTGWRRYIAGDRAELTIDAIPRWPVEMMKSGLNG